MKWRPISTLPSMRDAEFLECDLWAHRYGCDPKTGKKWKMERRFADAHREIHKPSTSGLNQALWTPRWVANGLNEHEWCITHWMPVPMGPEEE